MPVTPFSSVAAELAISSFPCWSSMPRFAHLHVTSHNAPLTLSMIGQPRMNYQIGWRRFKRIWPVMICRSMSLLSRVIWWQWYLSCLPFILRSSTCQLNHWSACWNLVGNCYSATMQSMTMQWSDSSQEQRLTSECICDKTGQGVTSSRRKNWKRWLKSVDLRSNQLVTVNGRRSTKKKGSRLNAGSYKPH